MEDAVLCKIRNFVFRNTPQFVYEKQIDKLFNVSFD
jgi:hypothetical protein